MHRGLVTCPPDATLGEAARLLISSHVHGVVVAEADGAPLGLLSDFDLLAGEWLAEDEETLATLRRLTARELMTEPVLTVAAAATLGEAAETMRRKRIGRLVVVEDGRAIGILSSSDVAAVLAAPPHGRSTVGEVMSHAFVVCRPDAPLASVARALAERRSRSVIVLAADGTAAGVVSRQDLLPLSPGETAARTAVDVMHPPLTTTPATPLTDAVDAMIRAEVHRLVVVGDDGRTPIGLLSSWDVLAETAAPGSAWLQGSG